MTLSARIQKGILDLLADEMPHSIQDIKNYLEQEQILGYTDGQFSGSINTLLRNKSIKKIERATYAINKGFGGDMVMKYCFIVSPIGEEGTEIRSNADKLFKHVICPVCENCGFKAERVDQINSSDSITQTIIDKIQSSDLVIADITDHNPNVFYEMGYRKCTNKPIIHLRRKGEALPFDVNTIRTFEYDLTDLDNVEELKKRLEQTIKTFTFDAINEDLAERDMDTNEKTFSSVLDILYQIQDSIFELKEQIGKRDTEMIQTIMQTSIKNAVKEESADVVMMKTLLPELIKNPQMFINLMQLAEYTDKTKK